MGAKENIRTYIKSWEGKGYVNGIPDEAPLELEKRGLVPSYRLICMAIMRNSNNLEMLGFQREKCDIYQEIKRIEIYNRDVKEKQLKFFL